MSHLAGARVALLLLGVSSACGCNAIVGIDEPHDKSTGDDAGAGLDATAPFLGVWQTSSGRGQTVCNGVVTPYAVTNTLTLTNGASPGAIVSTSSSSCTTHATVLNATTASATAGEGCSESLNGRLVTSTIVAGSFVLDAGGTTATLTLSGTLLVTSSTGQATCDFSETDPYSKTAS